MLRLYMGLFLAAPVDMRIWLTSRLVAQDLPLGINRPGYDTAGAFDASKDASFAL